MQKVGIPGQLAETVMAVLVISFAATTLDTATRIQRFVLTELGLALEIRLLTNRYLATALAVVPAAYLALWNVTDPTTGTAREAGWVLWPIFGASNQMLAALTLMVLTLYFWQRNKPIAPLIIPMLFIMVVTFVTLVLKTGDFYNEHRPLLVINLVLIALIGWMMLEGIVVVIRSRRQLKEMLKGADHG